MISWNVRSRAVLASLSVFVACTAAAAQSPGDLGLSVYYQVTYQDGNIEDLSQVPTTNEDIRMIVRISRYQPGATPRRFLATGRVPLGLTGRGWTIKTDLQWNGKAWVAPPVVRKMREPGADLVGTRSQTVQTAVVRKLIEAELKRQRNEMDKLTAAVARAENDLAGAQKPQDHQTAQTLLEAVREALRRSRQAVREYEMMLGRPGGRSMLHRSVGQVGPTKLQQRTKETLGVVDPLEQGRLMPHHTQVWKLPPGSGQRQYTVEMAHPEAGTFGGFYYVAYADTDGDGVPDRLIGRSDLAQAATCGGWTKWNFTTDASRVFVGNTWADADTTLYYGTRDVTNWRGLGGEVYISGGFGLTPQSRWDYEPYLTNLRIHVGSQNPD